MIIIKVFSKINIYKIYFLTINKCYYFPCMSIMSIPLKKMESASKKLSKKLKNNTVMKWQWVKNGEKLIIACDFYKHDDD